MRTYRVTLKDGQSFLMSADMSRGEVPIWVNWNPGARPDDEDDWSPTPYQSANFARIEVAAQSCASYMAEHGDCTEVASVEEVES